MSHKITANCLSEPEAGLARIAFRLRTQGFKWIWRRLRSEWILPTTRPGQMIHAGLRRVLAAGFAPIRALGRTMSAKVSAAADTLYAFYDLKVQPITFDIVSFIAGADLERRRLSLKHIHIVIVPGPNEGVRQEEPGYEAIVNCDARHWRIHNILIAVLSLLPSCTGFTLVGSRSEAAALRAGAGGHIYPRIYEPALPVAHHPNDYLLPARSGVRPIGVLRAGVEGLCSVDRWLRPRARGRRAIPITLRDYAYMTARNSNVPAWVEFARRLDPARYFPIFVLDTERTLDEVPPLLAVFEVFKEVSWNVGLRMALYERAWLNLGVNNGPMGLCWLNDRTRYIIFKMVTPSVAQTTEAFLRSRGFEPDQSLPFATPFQKWVWEDDTLDIIEREFQAMAARIEASTVPDAIVTS